MKKHIQVLTSLAVIAFLGSIGATDLQQQASAIIDNWREEFRVLIDQFEDAVSNATDNGNNDEITRLVHEFNRNVTMIFETEPQSETTSSDSAANNTKS